MATKRATKTTKSVKKKRKIRVGGSRSWADFALWQKLLLLTLFVGVVSSVSIFVYTQFKERDLLAKAAAYQKVDIRSNPRSSAGVTFHACKAVSGDNIKVTILATKPSSVAYATATVQTFKKVNGAQTKSAELNGRNWWGGEVLAMQLTLSKSKGDEMMFLAKSRQGTSRPIYTAQPTQKQFKTKEAYQAALREFQAATISPASFTDCESASTQPSSVCLNRKGSKVAVSQLQKARYVNYTIKSNTVIDARKAYWDGTDTNGAPVSWAVTVDGAGPACWYGGKYTGAWDDRSRTVTWSKDYHHAGAFTIRMPNFLVEGYRAHNQGDGIRMEQRAANFHMKDVYMSDMHDDCVENDFLHSGITENSLFEGCFAGLSAANYDANTKQPNSTWTVRNNLLSMKPFYTMYKPEKYGNYGHGMLFKGWYHPGQGPELVLENNIFMAERPASLGDLAIPKNAKLKSCRNNTFVWLGRGEFPYKLPSCFKITKDKKVWTDAVSRWKAEHPTVR